MNYITSVFVFGTTIFYLRYVLSYILQFFFKSIVKVLSCWYKPLVI
jgi:hypothetical protein